MNWVLSGSEKDRQLCVFSDMSQTEKNCQGAHAFCCLLIFFKINFFEKFFQEYHQCVKLDPDQAGFFLPCLGPIC